MSNEKTTPTPAPAPSRPGSENMKRLEDNPPFQAHEVRHWYMEMLTGDLSFSAFVEKLNSRCINHFTNSR